MIKKLKTKVFWILMLSISAIILGTIIIFAYSNYNNTINAATSMLDRFNGFEKAPNSDEQINMNENRVANIDLSNTYSYIVEQGKVTDTMGTQNSVIEEYAIKAYKKGKKSGIIGSYIYKTRSLKDGRAMIILMENQRVTMQIQYIYILSFCLRNNFHFYSVYNI